MKIENTIKVMKEINPHKIILVKVGTFYHAYGKDSYILSYLFGYQLKKIENNYSTCGFPVSAINKISTNLEDYKISYILLSKSNNYEEEAEEDFKNDNRYIEFYEKAKKYIVRKNRIEEIYRYLIENINDDEIKEKINKITEIIYEI